VLSLCIKERTSGKWQIKIHRKFEKFPWLPNGENAKGRRMQIRLLKKQEKFHTLCVGTGERALALPKYTIAQREKNTTLLALFCFPSAQHTPHAQI
jgi:hypothetical protein